MFIQSYPTLTLTLTLKRPYSNILFNHLDETEYGPSRNDDVALSLRSDLFMEDKTYIEWSERKWSLIQRNEPEPPKQGQKLANHRIIHSCSIEGDAIAFLERIGYTYSHEYIMKGYEFWLGSIQILIYRVYQVLFLWRSF